MSHRLKRTNILRRKMLVPRSATVESVLLDTLKAVVAAVVFTTFVLAVSSVFAAFACHFAPACTL